MNYFWLGPLLIALLSFPGRNLAWMNLEHIGLTRLDWNVIWPGLGLNVTQHDPSVCKVKEQI
ncbi:MAG: hypothetical protein ACREBC_03570 [Pyrinomonadaceae bacterium]